jgi:hypothetical protein
MIEQPSLRQPWTWQLLPDGLMYPSYLAGGREPRFASLWTEVHDGSPIWDAALGGRVGILRWGTQDPSWPEGWQLDIEGAAFPRLTLDYYRDLVASDFRFGIPLTHRRGPWEAKVAFYHLSSHLGDEFQLKHPGVLRKNYARDVVVLGLAWRPWADWRLYAEAGYGFYVAGGSQPWEFQLGVEFSPAAPTTIFGTPFFAANGRLREEVDFGGTLTAQVGWQWRGATGRRFRVGFQYANGKSEQFQFHDRFEETLALGLWYDY